MIIDEEHSNNTAKAKVIIDAFAAKNIIRVSATAIENKRYEFFEIDEIDVIDAGLITKALYVNEGISDNLEITDDYDYLLDLADAKRKDILKNLFLFPPAFYSVALPGTSESGRSGSESSAVQKSPRRTALPHRTRPTDPVPAG